MYTAPLQQVRKVVLRYAKYLVPQPFPTQKRPLVITPHDSIVQQAANEVGLGGKVDVIKLEPTCPPDRDAWVTNKDYIKGMEGKQRIIHLCYNKIRDRYRQIYKQNPGVQNAQQQQQLKDVIKEHLQSVTLPHEMVHIEQMQEHGGKFGPSPEPAAEKAEHPEQLKPYGVVLRAAGEKLKGEYFKQEKKHNLEYYEKHPSNLDAKQLDRIRKSTIGEYKGVKFYFVDGAYLRDNVCVDFTTGGNSGRYRYVPEGEIWIEEDPSQKDVVPSMLHEYLELQYMKGGATYDEDHQDDAHDKASEKEIACRKSYKPTKDLMSDFRYCLKRFSA